MNLVNAASTKQRVHVAGTENGRTRNKPRRAPPLRGRKLRWCLRSRLSAASCRGCNTSASGHCRSPDRRTAPRMPLPPNRGSSRTRYFTGRVQRYNDSKSMVRPPIGAVMTTSTLNRRHLLAVGSSIIATGVSGLQVPAQAVGLAPTRTISGGANNYRKGAPIV